MANCLYDTLVQGILVVVFIKTNIQSKIMNTTTHVFLQVHLTEGTECCNRSLSKYLNLCISCILERCILERVVHFRASRELKVFAIDRGSLVRDLYMYVSKELCVL